MLPETRFAVVLSKSSRIVAVKSSLQCAGLNRHEVEDERALQERSSDASGRALTGVAVQFESGGI